MNLFNRAGLCLLLGIVSSSAWAGACRSNLEDTVRPSQPAVAQPAVEGKPLLYSAYGNPYFEGDIRPDWQTRERWRPTRYKTIYVEISPEKGPQTFRTEDGRMVYVDQQPFGGDHPYAETAHGKKQFVQIENGIAKTYVSSDSRPVLVNWVGQPYLEFADADQRRQRFFSPDLDDQQYVDIIGGKVVTYTAEGKDVLLDTMGQRFVRDESAPLFETMRFVAIEKGIARLFDSVQFHWADGRQETLQVPVLEYSNRPYIRWNREDVYIEIKEGIAHAYFTPSGPLGFDQYNDLPMVRKSQEKIAFPGFPERDKRVFAKIIDGRPTTFRVGNSEVLTEILLESPFVLAEDGSFYLVKIQADHAEIATYESHKIQLDFSKRPVVPFVVDSKGVRKDLNLAHL